MNEEDSQFSKGAGSESKYCKGFTAKAMLGLLRPLYRLTSGTAVLRAFRGTAAAEASNQSS